jgi:hypothetical protein
VCVSSQGDPAGFTYTGVRKGLRENGVRGFVIITKIGGIGEICIRYIRRFRKISTPTESLV